MFEFLKVAFLWIIIGLFVAISCVLISKWKDMDMGNKEGVNAQLSLDEAETSVLAALENGYHLIDTANAYVNEKAVGRAMKKGMAGTCHGGY